MQQFQAGRGTQRGVVLVGPAQPAQVHEGGAQALAAVDELDQHIGGHVDTGVGQLRDAVVVDEVGDVGQRGVPDAVAPDLELRIVFDRRAARGMRAPLSETASNARKGCSFPVAGFLSPGRAPCMRYPLTENAIRRRCSWDQFNATDGLSALRGTHMVTYA